MVGYTLHQHRYMFGHSFSYFVFLLLALPGLVNGQTKRIDSLKKAINYSSDKQTKLKNLLLLCDERQSLHNDSLYKYAEQAGSLAAALKNDHQIMEATFYKNTSLLKKGLLDTVIKNCDETLKQIALANKNDGVELGFIQLKGMALIRKNLFKEAIAQNYVFLQKAEAINDTLMQVKAKTGIAWAYMELGQNDDAIGWCKKALATSQNSSLFDRYTTVYNNLASSYNNIQRYDSALFYVDKTLKAVQVYEDLTAEANAKNIKADIFINTRQTKQAQQLLEEALQTRMRIGDQFYVLSDLYQLSVFYAHNGQPQRGIATALQGIETARQFNLGSKLTLLYSGLAECYRINGEAVKYAGVLETILQLKDSMYEHNSAEALAGLQTQYNLQKKENIIIQQKLDIVRRDYFIAGSAMVLVLIFMSIFYLYNMYKRRAKIRLDNMIQIQKEKELNAVSEAEENQRKRIAAELHDNMGAQISFICSNIDWIIDSPAPLTETEQKERLQTVHETSQGLMRALRETIWALNRDKIALDEFADKLKAYIQTFLQFQPLLHFQSHEKIESVITLKPIQALNMFRIFQEGVNNTIKYAKAGNITLDIVGINNRFEIRLVDNGKGFNPLAVGGEHYGLQIMKHRASEAGFVFELNSGSGMGTEIIVSGVAEGINTNELLTIQ
jgi:signal transduction histidine kinase